LKKDQLKNNPNLWKLSKFQNLKPPEQLGWVLPNIICDSIGQSISVVNNEIANLDYQVLSTNKGKGVWKKIGVSPDAVVQLALQLTYIRLHLHRPAVYESVSTRHFRRGRTETGRSLTSDSVNFIDAFMDSSIPDATKMELFSKAEISHVQYAKQASNAQGCDRHLLGLKLLTLENKEELHPLFKDPIFEKSSHWLLSTSTLAPKFITSICFGPVCSDGYGVCYTFRENDLNFAISSFKRDPFTDTNIFCLILNQNLNNLENFLAKMKQPSKL